MKVGLSGEFRLLVTREDGSIKLDTGYNSNLILDQGLDFFGLGGGQGDYLNQYCLIGAGNTAPEASQTALDSVIKGVEYLTTSSDYTYTDEGDGLYKFWEERKYRFEGLGDINISEVGLASKYTSISNYYLTTRALIKDSEGLPTTISLKTGETLDVFYKIHKQYSTVDEVFQVNILDGEGGVEPFNVTVRPNAVGSSKGYNNNVSSYLGVNVDDTRNMGYLFADELEPIEASSTDYSTHRILAEKFKLSTYVTGTFKRVLTIKVGIDDGNIPEGIRRFRYRTGGASFAKSPVPFMPLQLRFGSVADDSPIMKTDKESLDIPIEFSWGRVEEEV